jgi:hypothetical protein
MAMDQYKVTRINFKKEREDVQKEIEHRKISPQIGNRVLYNFKH